jgi:hypothetical protein
MTMCAKHLLAGTLPVVFALVGCAGTQGPAANAIPAALQQIESQAEDAYDHALASNHEAIASDASSISSGWRSFRAQAAGDGAGAADLSAMDAAVSAFSGSAATSTDVVALARAANGVSATMDELFALYEAPVPPEVLSLDYLGREIVLDARAGDSAAARTDIDELEATFASIRARLVAGGGDQVATDYDASVAAMRADVAVEDAASLQRDANAGLEIVDEMEGVFESAAVAAGEKAD